MLLFALACVAFAQQAPAPGPGAGRSGARPDVGQPFDVTRMVDMLAERAHLTPAEKTLTEKAVRAKIDAAMGLGRELQTLRDAAANGKATDAQLKAALAKYDAALASYRQRVKAIDAQLIKSVSLRTRVALTAVGVIDNGLGAIGRRFGGAMGRMGGTRGGGFGGFGAPNAARPGANR
jgi:hypothetical protein